MRRVSFSSTPHDIFVHLQANPIFSRETAEAALLPVPPLCCVNYIKWRLQHIKITVLHKMLSEMIPEEFLRGPTALYCAVCCCSSVTSWCGLSLMPQWEHGVIYATHATDQNSLILIM